jgi:asparagine synthase (glutamine-hydrolysing)
MSGITGIFYRDGRNVKPELIEEMNDKLAHRGPDGSSFWCDGSVAFGHQMLWTTPESLHERLPFEDEKTGLFITADARIDNRKELSEELDIEDKENVPDSYFILKAYEKWGEKCPEFLLGDFAFVIWDRNDETIFCARDHMGIKTFYYHLSDEMFLFSTEIKALFYAPVVQERINELQIATFLELILNDDRDTSFYEEIFRLPAATSLKINYDNFYFKKYWELDLDYEIRFETDEEYEKVFLDIFTEAVRCRLRSAFQVGSMLSGGLDSSSVTCTAQKILFSEGKNKLKTFSAVFDSVPKSNERHFIEKVLLFRDFDYFFINADEINPLNEIDDYFWYADNPFVVPNTFMNYNIFREANKNSVRILLDGLEGDEIVSHGYGFLTELFRTMRWKKLIIEINALRNIKSVAYKLILIEIGFNSLPNFFKRKLLSIFEYKQKRGSKYKILQKDFAEKVNLKKIINKIKEKRFEIKDAHEQHYADVNSSIIQSELEIVDWMSVPFNIELRHPFFDKRLVEFCLAIPTEQKISNGWDRYIMRRSMSKILPEEIQWRKTKGDLSFNFVRSFMDEKEQIEKLTMENNYLIEKYVSSKKFKEIYKECKSGNTENIMYIWNALLLNLWLSKRD